jgi:hypothetical protein
MVAKRLDLGTANYTPIDWIEKTRAKARRGLEAMVKHIEAKMSSKYEADARILRLELQDMEADVGRWEMQCVL